MKKINNIKYFNINIYTPNEPELYPAPINNT